MRIYTLFFVHISYRSYAVVVVAGRDQWVSASIAPLAEHNRPDSFSLLLSGLFVLVFLETCIAFIRLHCSIQIETL